MRSLRRSLRLISNVDYRVLDVVSSSCGVSSGSARALHYVRGRRLARPVQRARGDERELLERRDTAQRDARRRHNRRLVRHERCAGRSSEPAGDQR